jgi:type IV pilus assembly protein PilF
MGAKPMRLERAAVLALSAALAIAFAGPAAAWGKPRAPAELSASGRADVMLAQSYLSEGQVGAAEARAKAALLSDPNSQLTHATMALVLVAQKQNAKAQGEFNRALALAPNDGAVLNAYGSFLCGKGDRAGAEDAFRRALADPTYLTPIQPLVNAGSCAMFGKDWLKADGYLRRALKIAPTSRPLLLLLADVQLKLNRPMEARAFVQRSDALGPDARTLELAVLAEEAAGDAQAEARYRKRLHEEFPNYTLKAEGGRTQ